MIEQATLDTASKHTTAQHKDTQFENVGVALVTATHIVRFPRSDLRSWPVKTTNSIIAH